MAAKLTLVAAPKISRPFFSSRLHARSRVRAGITEDEFVREREAGYRAQGPHGILDEDAHASTRDLVRAAPQDRANRSQNWISRESTVEAERVGQQIAAAEENLSSKDARCAELEQLHEAARREEEAEVRSRPVQLPAQKSKTVLPQLPSRAPIVLIHVATTIVLVAEAFAAWSPVCDVMGVDNANLLLAIHANPFLFAGAVSLALVIASSLFLLAHFASGRFEQYIAKLGEKPRLVAGLGFGAAAAAMVTLCALGLGEMRGELAGTLSAAGVVAPVPAPKGHLVFALFTLLPLLAVAVLQHRAAALSAERKAAAAAIAVALAPEPPEPVIGPSPIAQHRALLGTRLREAQAERTEANAVLDGLYAKAAEIERRHRQQLELFEDMVRAFKDRLQQALELDRLLFRAYLRREERRQERHRAKQEKKQMKLARRKELMA